MNEKNLCLNIQQETLNKNLETNDSIKENIVTENLKFSQTVNNIVESNLPKTTSCPPCTPALAKARQSRLEFKVQSPSDALMSPCTKKLACTGSRKTKNAISQPQTLLRSKQHKDLLRKLPED